MKLLIAAFLLFTVLYCTFSQTTTTCPPVDIVFVIDTSGSMADEGKALCGAISNVVTQLTAQGITLSQKKIYGITDTALAGVTCFDGNVYKLYGGSVGSDPCPFPASGSESWGPGTAIIAQKFAWTPNAVRVIVPMSDEGPCQGNNNGLGDGKDSGTITNAINIAKAKNVIVSPIRGTNDPGFTAAQYADVLKFMTQLASATGGTVTTSAGTKTSTIDMSNNIVSIVKKACIVAVAASKTSAPSPPPSQTRAPAPSPPPSNTRAPAPSPPPSVTSGPSKSRAPAPSPPPSVTSAPSNSRAPAPSPPPSVTSGASKSRAPAPSPPPSVTSGPSRSSAPSASTIPSLNCATGSNLVPNPNFQSGTYNKGYQGSNLNFVGIGKGDYDVLNSEQGQTNIASWKVAAGPILWSSAAFPNAPGTPMTIGMLPGSSITTQITVPIDGIGYKLELYVAANPWSPANLKTAATIQSLRIEVRGATYNRFASPAGFIPVQGNQGWYRAEYTFTTRKGQKNYILDLQLGGQAYSLGSTPFSGTQTGILVGGLTLCQGAASVALEIGDRCAGRDQYLSNNGFYPGSGDSPRGNYGFGVGNLRIYPWVVSKNAIDHYFGYWQNAAGSDYSVDLSGTDPLMLGAIQQSVILPSTARTYTLNFDLSGNVDCAPTTKHLRIRILDSNQNLIPGATVDYEFNTAGRTKDSMGWVNKQWNFKSVEGKTNYIVEFSSLDNTNCGPVITLAYLCWAGDNPPVTRPMVCNAGSTANAVSNGDFELFAHPFTPAPWVQVYAGSAYITSWTVIDGTVELYDQTGWKPPSGTKSIDLDGISAGTLTQTLHLPYGYPWSLTFAMAANYGTPPIVKTMTVTIYKADATQAVVTKRDFTWTSDPALYSKDNMGWKYQTMDFNTFAETADYIVEFKSTVPGYGGMAIDDVRVCSPFVLTYPPTTPYVSGSVPSTWTVTADNTFEFYVDGTEVKPVRPETIDTTSGGGCASAVKYTPYNKYCCVNAASNDHPRCDWSKTETFTVPTDPQLSIIAVHVINFPTTPPSPPNSAVATDPLTGGGNPAAFLASYQREGRQCGVSDLSDWRCTSSVSAADVASGAWTKRDYVEDANWKTPVSFGLNGPGAFKEFGGSAAKLYNGDSIWYSGAGQQKGIPLYAQWIWSDFRAAGEVPQIWCRTFVPNLYC